MLISGNYYEAFERVHPERQFTVRRSDGAIHWAVALVQFLCHSETNFLLIMAIHCHRDDQAGLVGVAYLARVALTEHNAKIKELVEKSVRDEKTAIDKTTSSINEFLLFSIPVVAVAYVGLMVYFKHR